MNFARAYNAVATPMTASGPPVAAARHPGSNRGAWTIVAIFALGFAVLAGLFAAPRGHAPPLPTGGPRGLPGRPVTGVLLDCRPLGPSPDAVLAALRDLEPDADVVLLVDVEASLVPPVVEALGLQASYHPQLYQRVRPTPGGKEKIGLCILSPHPQYAGRPIRLADGRVVGVAADVVVDGSAFSVACLDLREPSYAAVRSAPPTSVLAEPFEGFEVVAGRSEGALFVDALNAADGASVVRRRTAPDGLAFRLAARGGPATRPG